jgi:hypothetical protein
MAENEELKLTVTLVDNASAGLRQLQTQMREIGGGSGAQDAQRAARNFQEMHERGLKPLFETIDKAGKVVLPEFARGLSGGISGLVAFGAGAATAGIAITKMLESIESTRQSFNEFVNNSIRLSQLATVTGQHAAEIKKVEEAYERMGESAQHADEDFLGMAHTLADSTRAVSVIRQEFLKGVLTPEQRAELVKGWGLLSKEDVIGALNLSKQFSEYAKENAIKAARERGDTETAARARGAEVEAEILRELGDKYRQFVGGPIEKVTKEEREAQDANIAAAKQFIQLSATIAQHWDHIATNMWRSVASSPALINAMRQFNTWLDSADANAKLIVDDIIALQKELQPIADFFNWLVDNEAKIAKSWKDLVGAPSVTPNAGGPSREELKNQPPVSWSDWWRSQRGLPPAGAATPQRFFESGSLEDKMLQTGGRYSTNIEDNRKVQIADGLQKETARLADEMKKLNDYLQLGTAAASGAPGGAYPILSADGGGLGGGLDGGGGGLAGGGAIRLPSSLGGGFRAPGGGGGLRMPGGGGGRGLPHGSDVGPGTGEGAGETPAYSGAGGSKFLEEQRAPFKAELEGHPELKRHLAALLTRENEGEAQAVTESLFNRTAYVNAERAKKGLAPLSIRQMLGIGSGRSFYGPERRGEVAGAEAALLRQPRREAALEAQIEAAYSSNLLRGATDQGSGRDPNVNWPGGRIKLHERGGETYTDWGGGPGGHEGARKFREQQQEAVRRGGLLNQYAGDDYQIASNSIRRSMIDKQMTHRVEGSGHISVDVNGPKGTGVRARSSGIFRTVSVSRHTQMERAASSSDVEE